MTGSEIGTSVTAGFVHCSRIQSNLSELLLIDLRKDSTG